MMSGRTKNKNAEWYTNENPGGPWARALEAMGERVRKIEESGCSKDEPARNKELKAIISELILEYWRTKDKVEKESREKQRELDAEEDSETRVFEQEIIPLDSFKGLESHITHKLGAYVQYATLAVFRLSYERPMKGILLRLQDDFTPANYAGNMENIAPCIDLQFYREDFTFSLWGYTSCSIKYLESPNGKYVQLGKDDFGCLTTFAFIALSVDQLEPFYDVLVEFISKMLPFDLGDIELAGYEDVVRRCEKIICYDNPITMKRHILLAGPPGCGKSMIMKQVAKNHPEYVRCNLTQTKKWLGWIKVFAKILEKCNKKVLLIIDEIDELGLRRDRNGESVYELLRLMDGTENVRNLLIMASTNRVNDLDPALLRAGRFGPVINVDKPNPDQKKAIMEFYCQRYNCRVNIDEIVRTVKGRYSGADIRIAFEDCLIQGVDLSTENVQRNLLEYAVSPGVGRTFSPIQEV